jgi:hypothetical protein
MPTRPSYAFRASTTVSTTRTTVKTPMASDPQNAHHRARDVSLVSSSIESLRRRYISIS